jgi:SAM-dependent methyltransferase
MHFQQIHAGRVQVLGIFSNLISHNMTSNSRGIEVAVVGGSINEPELTVLRELSYKFNVTFFGIGNNEIYLNLNELDGYPKVYNEKYDLLICCQVLEHVYDIKNALRNLSQLLAPEGMIWINVPASNLKHGSPEYFSAGYQSKLISNLLLPMGVKELELGDVGSKRLYFMTHKQQYWPSYLEHRFPLVRGIHSRKWLFPFKTVKYFFRNFQAVCWSPKFLYGSNFSTESYYLGKKISGRA